jgi:hypothetical protein
MILPHLGEVAEWSKAAVLKTVEPSGSGGSNPSLSAKPFRRMATDYRPAAHLYILTYTTGLCRNAECEPTNPPFKYRPRSCLLAAISDNAISVLGKCVLPRGRLGTIGPYPTAASRIPVFK